MSREWRRLELGLVDDLFCVHIKQAEMKDQVLAYMVGNQDWS